MLWLLHLLVMYSLNAAFIDFSPSAQVQLPPEVPKHGFISKAIKRQYKQLAVTIIAVLL